MNRDKQINVRLTAKELSQLEQLAQDHSMTISELVRSLIDGVVEQRYVQGVKQSRVVVMVLHYNDMGKLLESDCQIREVVWGNAEVTRRVILCEAEIAADACADNLHVG